MQMKITSANRDLIQAFLVPKNEQEMAAFLRDLLTIDEIKDFSRRLEVAQMLDKKISYKKIEEKTKMSSTTIARIAKFFRGNFGGYRLILDRLANKHHNSHLVASGDSTL
jgi:TrpR-related protein YerC/YecD